MKNPHEKLAMEFFSPPGPSAREWRCIGADVTKWMDGALFWPKWLRGELYEIRLKPQTITLPERTIPKPLDVEELVNGGVYFAPDLIAPPATSRVCYNAEKPAPIFNFLYPDTIQGEKDAIAAAKGMRGRRDEG